MGLGVALTQASLFIPRYVLAEVALSFLGLGVTEPAPSWGNMLATLQQYYVMEFYWWMFLPAVALIPIFLAYYTFFAYYTVGRNALSGSLGSGNRPDWFRTES